MARPSASEDVFRALADPTRRRMVELLREGPKSPSQLAAVFDSCQSTVSEHLGTLRRAGVIGFEERAGRRSYHLVPGSLDDLITWVDSIRSDGP